MDKQISDQNHRKTNIVVRFYIEIQFDKSFHPVVQYENYPICVFMNINENIKLREKNNIRSTSIPEGNQTCIEDLGHILMDANWFDGTT